MVLSLEFFVVGNNLENDPNSKDVYYEAFGRKKFHQHIADLMICPSQLFIHQILCINSLEIFEFDFEENIMTFFQYLRHLFLFLWKVLNNLTYYSELFSLTQKLFFSEIQFYLYFHHMNDCFFCSCDFLVLVLS